MRSHDTTAEAAAVYTAAYMSLSGAERIERSMEMAEEVKEVTLAEIRHRNPEFTPAEVHEEWLSHWAVELGIKCALKAVLAAASSGSGRPPGF